MNILLTGGTGYIGSHTALVLAQAGHSITLFDNLCNSQISVVSRLETLSAQKMDFVQGDVRDTPLLSSVLKERNIDAVIHFAGLKAVGDSVKNPVEYYANNVQGSISLLQAMQANHIKTLVFSSSATVYGVPQYLPYDETHPTKAINPYGSTKLQIEDMLRDVAASDPEWSIAVLRYFNPVGAHESGLIGEMPSGVPNNLMPYLVQVASGKREELRIFGNDYDTNAKLGRNNVSFIIQGRIDVKEVSGGYTLTSTTAHAYENGDTLSSVEDPIFFAKYTGDREQFGVKNARMVINPHDQTKIKEWLD